MLLLGATAFESKSFRLPAAAELLSLCVAKEKDNQRERPPRLALAGHPARQVREPGPGFSTGHPALAKRSRHPCRLPLRGLSSPPHRRTGAPVEQRAILARTFRRGWSKATAPHADCHVPPQGQELQSQLLTDLLRPISAVRKFQHNAQGVEDPEGNFA
jgi:hypothetical protein